MGQLETAVDIFRNNIFVNKGSEGFIPTSKQLSEFVKGELSKDSGEENTIRLVVEKSYDGNVSQFVKDLYHAQQIILEFMDKGMKGLLTGDMSVFSIKIIQGALEKYQPKL